MKFIYFWAFIAFAVVASSGYFFGRTGVEEARIPASSNSIKIPSNMFFGGMVTNRRGDFIGLTCVDKAAKECESFNFTYKSHKAASEEPADVLNKAPLTKQDLLKISNDSRFVDIPSVEFFGLTKSISDATNGFEELRRLGGVAISLGVGAFVGLGSSLALQGEKADGKEVFAGTAGGALGGYVLAWSFYPALDIVKAPIYLPVQAVRRLVARINNKKNEKELSRLKSLIDELEDINFNANRNKRVSNRKFHNLKAALEKL